MVSGSGSNKSVLCIQVSVQVQEVFGGTDHLLPIHYILCIWYDMDCIKNTVCSSFSFGMYSLPQSCVYWAVAWQKVAILAAAFEPWGVMSLCSHLWAAHSESLQVYHHFFSEGHACDVYDHPREWPHVILIWTLLPFITLGFITQVESDTAVHQLLPHWGYLSPAGIEWGRGHNSKGDVISMLIFFKNIDIRQKTKPCPKNGSNWDQVQCFEVTAVTGRFHSTCTGMFQFLMLRFWAVFLWEGWTLENFWISSYLS